MDELGVKNIDNGKKKDLKKLKLISQYGECLKTSPSPPNTFKFNTSYTG